MLARAFKYNLFVAVAFAGWMSSAIGKDTTDPMLENHRREVLALADQLGADYRIALALEAEGKSPVAALKQGQLDFEKAKSRLRQISLYWETEKLNRTQLLNRAIEREAQEHPERPIIRKLMLVPSFGVPTAIGALVAALAYTQYHSIFSVIPLALGPGFGKLFNIHSQREQAKLLIASLDVADPDEALEHRTYLSEIFNRRLSTWGVPAKRDLEIGSPAYWNLIEPHVTGHLNDALFERSRGVDATMNEVSVYTDETHLIVKLYDLERAKLLELAVRLREGRQSPLSSEEIESFEQKFKKDAAALGQSLYARALEVQNFEALKLLDPVGLGHFSMPLATLGRIDLPFPPVEIPLDATTAGALEHLQNETQNNFNAGRMENELVPHPGRYFLRATVVPGKGGWDYRFEVFRDFAARDLVWEKTIHLPGIQAKDCPGSLRDIH